MEALASGLRFVEAVPEGVPRSGKAGAKRRPEGL